MTHALRFEGVSIDLGARRVLSGVDLELGRGELVALAGPNGAGKTTLLRAATRTLSPCEGRIVLGRDPLSDLSRRSLAQRVAIVPQETQIPFPFSALEVVLMGRSPHLNWLGFESEEDVAIARRAMESVGVGELAERSILELSGGERQLVIVARALAQSPEVLLLDEPTAFLDLKNRTQVLSLVRAWVREEGRSALVVSHDLGLAAQAADRVALVAEGCVQGVGPPEEVLTAENLQRAFGVEATVIEGPGGKPVVVPRLR